MDIRPAAYNYTGAHKKQRGSAVGSSLTSCTCETTELELVAGSRAPRWSGVGRSVGWGGILVTGVTECRYL